MQDGFRLMVYESLQYNMQRLVVLLVLLLISPVSLASPPPGEPDIVNDICSTWNSSDGNCDDYQSILDGSTTDEWIKSSISVNVDDAESVSLTIATAIHELSRADLNLEDLDLEGDSDFGDGIPADYIRNYLDLDRNGLTVEDRMLSLIQNNMKEYIEDNFDYTESSLLNTISSIEFSSDSELQCTYSKTLDSIDEVNGFPNDPFNPPICFRGVFVLVLNPSKLGLNEDTGDINRMMQGVLLMGGDINSSFNAKALPGHYVELTVLPPDYSTAYQVDNPGILLTDNFPNQYPQSYGHLSLDNTNPEIITSISEDLNMRIKNRNPLSVLSINDEQPALTIDIVIDARDSSNTEIEMILSIHHLKSETLDAWMIDLDDGNMNLPIITSDGIRMINTELDRDLTDLINGIPIQSLSLGFSELFGSEIHFLEPIFSPSDDEGGLDFRHKLGETCNELLEVKYCLDGDESMSGQNPIYIESSSQSVQLKISKIIENMLGSSLGDVSTLDFSIINDEDLAAAMSIIEVEFSSNTDWLQDLLPIGFPNTNINFELFLPEWIKSTKGDRSILEIKSSFHNQEISKLGLEGARQFDWEHPICLNSEPCEDTSKDLICSSKQGTCITSKVEFFFNNVAINELNSAIKIDFEAELTLSIHRLKISSGQEGIELKPIPSDLIHRAIAVGDRRSSVFVIDDNGGTNIIEGGLLGGSEISAPIDFGNGHEINLVISNSGMNQFANELNDLFPIITEENSITGFPLDLGFDKYELNVDLESTPFSFEPKIYQIPSTITPSDLNPINFSASIRNAEMSITSDNNQIDLDVHRSYINSLFNDNLGWPFGDPITTDFGITFEESQMQQKIFPIMEHTTFGTIRSSALIVIHMPNEFRFTSFESSNGLSNISEINNRQVLTYLTPICPESISWDNCKRNYDTVTYNLEYSWTFVFAELIPYGIIFSTLFGLLVVRIIRNRKEKQHQKIIQQEVEQERLTEDAAVAEFGAMNSPILMVEESFFEMDTIEENNEL
ncbi:MAG: hypothetical protein L7S41_00925 [Candidatus Thalassarchaeaceae archaeon]|nr:hypothetical protein [Candidatus Thalassarchaeaceae archaeon]